jgi:hypothetical protein
MEAQPSLSDYRVEVSGWDVAESFFVEKATLELSPQGERIVHLRHPLRTGLLVFLRLIDSRVAFPAEPIAYEVLDISGTSTAEVSRVTLRKLAHRRSGDPEILPPGEAAGIA